MGWWLTGPALWFMLIISLVAKSVWCGWPIGSNLDNCPWNCGLRIWPRPPVQIDVPY